ncbi:MAG: holo-ACP synthase [Verrucomicrobiota bacterium]
MSGGILGIGVDLVENQRMKEVLGKWDSKFKSKVFRQGEQEYCDSQVAPFRHYAGRFAVKEAVSKAFGTGVGPQLSWLDIEVVRNAVSGAPYVELYGSGRQLAKDRKVGQILVSLAHTRDYAVAHTMILEQI